MSTPQLLESIEDVLANHRAFGNSHYIHEQLHICFQRRLSKISAHLPVAGQLLDALSRADPYVRYRTIGDTVVRAAIQHALSQIETGDRYGLPLSECEEVFRATIRHLDQGTCG